MQAIQFNPAIHPSFKQQFDKLTEAYINNEVNPSSACACFVGNLLNKSREWAYSRKFDYEQRPVKAVSTGNLTHIVRVIENEAGGLYTPEEIFSLETLFMFEVKGGMTEEKIFIAFDKTLALLKQIHEAKGEIIDEVPAFTKRQLATV